MTGLVGTDLGQDYGRFLTRFRTTPRNRLRFRLRAGVLAKHGARPPEMDRMPQSYVEHTDS